MTIHDRRQSVKSLTKPAAEEPFGPPLIGALLRVPWEAVQRHMLERLHERGFDDLDVAHLNVFQYPGPQGARPSELAARLRISKQALNYLLGEARAPRLPGASGQIPTTFARNVSFSPFAAPPRSSRSGDAVDEVEVAWAQQLGPERFAQLRNLLLELNQLT